MMDKKETLQLYARLSDGAKIAIHSLEVMRHKSDDTEFSKELVGTISEYRQIEKEAEQKIEELGGTPKPLSAFLKLNGKFGIEYKTLVNASKAKLSEIIIDGFDTGERNLSSYEKKYINAEDDAKALCRELLDMQREETRVYAKYLN